MVASHTHTYAIKVHGTVHKTPIEVSDRGPVTDAKVNIQCGIVSPGEHSDWVSPDLLHILSA